MYYNLLICWNVRKVYIKCRITILVWRSRSSYPSEAAKTQDWAVHIRSFSCPVHLLLNFWLFQLCSWTPHCAEEQEPCGVLEGAGHVPSSLGRLPGSGQVLLLRSSPSAMQRENERIAARPRSFSHPPAYVPSFLKASNFLNEASVPQDQDAALWEPSSVNRLKTVWGNRGPERGTPIGGGIWINERLCCRLQV